MQYKDTTKRSLSPVQASGEDPFEADQPAKGAQLPLGGAPPATQQNSAEDRRAKETSIWFRSKCKRMLKCTRNKRGLTDETSIDAGSVLSGIVEGKRRDTVVCVRKQSSRKHSAAFALGTASRSGAAHPDTRSRTRR